MSTTLANADWLNEPDLQKLLTMLSENGEEARVNGGAVRNSLLDEPVADVDISTTMTPEMIIDRLGSAGIKVVATGIEHGTVTAVSGGKGYEITTLRADIKTDGRHAIVRFGRDWLEDAMRRDFTINALYADREGNLYDPLGAIDDVKNRRVRFIGEAEDRIREDHLRILRFFRFFAWYGHGAPDRDGLKACVRTRQLLDQLSVERVWKELCKLLSAPNPARAVLWMRQSGVLSIVLPESEKWGIDALARVVQAESALGWGIDPLLRLMAIIPPQQEFVKALGQRLKISNAHKLRLENWINSALPPIDSDDLALGKCLYRGVQQGIIDRLRLELARLRQAGIGDDAALLDAAKMSHLLDYAINWQKPQFPVKGRDLVNLGVSPGKALGNRLEMLEERWVESGFALDKQSLIDT